MPSLGPVAKRPRPAPLCDMRPHRMPPPRRWARRPKVSSCLVAGFPWEVVFKHLCTHPRSLILLQMVDKNLAHAICTNHALWRSVFKRDVYRAAYATREVKQSRYPGLKLCKSGVTGVPVHMGPIRGDPDDHRLAPNFDAVFSAYVRKAFALMHGQRCGLCGCRWHHEAYWSLGMRVCRLCMAGNTVTNWELADKYGVHFFDVLRSLGGKVFYFLAAAGVGQDRSHPFSVRRSDLVHRRHVWVFWRPHLETCLDLPALYREQQDRRAAALLLCAVVRRARVRGLRAEFAGRGRQSRRTVDCLVMALYREERTRLAWQSRALWDSDSFCHGAGDWGFAGQPRCGVTRHQRMHGESKHTLATYLFRWEDNGPSLFAPPPRAACE